MTPGALLKVALGLIAGVVVCILVAYWAQWMQMVGEKIAQTT